MSTEQLKALKESLLSQLGLAGAELHKTLDLLNSTVPFELGANEPPPSLPLGKPGQTLQVSALAKGPMPAPPDYAQYYDSTLSIATKSNAISKAANNLTAASQSLRTVTQGSSKDWEVFTGWKRDGWTIQTRGAGPQANLGSTKGLEQCAKDIVAVVACEESPAPLRNIVAYLKHDQQVDLVKMKHGRRRLVLRFQRDSNSSEEVYLSPEAEGSLMKQAKQELFEEDLFREVSLLIWCPCYTLMSWSRS